MYAEEREMEELKKFFENESALGPRLNDCDQGKVIQIFFITTMNQFLNVLVKL